LPSGATEHIDGAPVKAREALKKLLEEFKDIFPAELPGKLPPDRGLNDVHTISVVDGAVPPVKKMYR